MSDDQGTPVPDDTEREQEIFKKGMEEVEAQIPGNTEDISGEAFGEK